jgi:hypothetical protein
MQFFGRDTFKFWIIDRLALKLDAGALANRLVLRTDLHSSPDITRLGALNDDLLHPAAWTSSILARAVGGTCNPCCDSTAYKSQTARAF